MLDAKGVQKRKISKFQQRCKVIPADGGYIEETYTLCTVWALFNVPITPAKNLWMLSENFEPIESNSIPKHMPPHLQKLILKKGIKSKPIQYWNLGDLEVLSFEETILTIRNKKEIPNKLMEMGDNSSGTELSRILRIKGKIFGAISVFEEMGDLHHHLIEI